MKFNNILSWYGFGSQEELVISLKKLIWFCVPSGVNLKDKKSSKEILSSFQLYCSEILKYVILMVSCIASEFFSVWATRKAHVYAHIHIYVCTYINKEIANYAMVLRTKIFQCQRKTYTVYTELGS